MAKFVINNGAAVTNSTLVTLTLSAAGPNPVTAMQLSTDGLNFSHYEPFTVTRGMTLTAGDWEKRVYVRFKDQLDIESAVFFDAIVLDGTAPSAFTVNVTTPTNQTSQLLNGTVETGATLQVSGLTEGANTVTATATDAAGNVATHTAVITVDTTAPFLNIDTILGGRLDQAAISGTAEKGSRIAVNCDRSSADVIFFDSFLDTKWSAMIGGLSEGDDHCVVTAKDSYGNVTIKTAVIIAVDNNGSFSGKSVSLEDALKALRMAVGLVIPTAEELLRGDVFEDGRIDVADVILILKKAVGL